MLYLVLKMYTLFLPSEVHFLSEILGFHIWANPHMYFNFVLYTHRSPLGIQALLLLEKETYLKKGGALFLKSHKQDF